MNIVFSYFQQAKELKRLGFAVVSLESSQKTNYIFQHCIRAESPYKIGQQLLEIPFLVSKLENLFFYLKESGYTDVALFGGKLGLISLSLSLFFVLKIPSSILFSLYTILTI